MGLINLQSSELDFIEEDIHSRLLGISKGEGDYSTKYFHLPFIKGHTIRIHSQKKILPNINSYLTEDRLAHQLSFFGDEFPENFYRGVNHIILIPEFVKSDKYFLTHIYIPSDKILSFYLYPSRLQLDVDTFQENRITGRKILRHGLLHNTAATISQIYKYNAEVNKKNINKSLHKFIYPSNELSREEILDLKEFSEMTSYSNLFSGNHS